MTTQHPEALRDARWYMVNKDGMATLCTDKADAEKEAADAQSVWPHMGPHRAVQLVEAADVEAMRAGYAAARLDIESLQARIKTMAEEHADELMVAHLDGRARAAQPAGAQHPGTAYADLMQEASDWICEHVQNETTGAMMWAIRLQSAAQKLRASHGQAPAQAAPAAVAGPSDTFRGDTTCLVQSIIALLELDAEGALVPHGIGGHARALLSAAASRLAAAPTTQTAPQQEAQEPYSIDADPQGIRALVADAITGALAFGAQGTNAPPDGHWLAPFWAAARAESEAAPQPSPASHGNGLDTARLDWLDKNIFHRDMDEWDAKHGGRGDCNMWVMFAPKGAQGGARSIIDAAMNKGGA